MTFCSPYPYGIVWANGSKALEEERKALILSLVAEEGDIAPFVHSPNEYVRDTYSKEGDVISIMGQGGSPFRIFKRGGEWLWSRSRMGTSDIDRGLADALSSLWRDGIEYSWEYI